MTDFIYDIECLPNVFTCTTKNTDTGRYVHFEISPRRNDHKKYVAWLHRRARNGDRMVGFNNIHYDYPMTHALATDFLNIHDRKTLNTELKKLSDKIIRSGNLPGLGRFKYTLWAHDQIVPQIDLFRIYHFDNKSKRTSLKRLQFNMRLESIVEFEIGFDKPVKKSSVINALLAYNEYDVESTEYFYNLSNTQIAFREEMMEKIGKPNLLSANDSKIGMDYLAKDISEEIGEHVLKTENGKTRTTPRKVIPLEDVIFDYIKFDTPEFKEVLDFMMTLKVFNINNQFHWNEKDNYPKGHQAILDAKEEVTKLRRKGLRKGDELLDSKEEYRNRLMDKYQDYNISCELDGFSFDFGKGGLHGARKGSVYRSDKTHVILDVDVTGFYPDVGIKNGLFPEHLTKKFCPLYAKLPVLRAKYKKGTVLNKLFKLIQNSFYGNTKEKHSYAYDPKYTIATTINGQLMLCMLWEKLRELDDIEIIQANTDGITFFVNRKLVKQAGKICRQWQKDTMMRLEQATYSQMFTRDVNNYVCQYKDGSIKAKGAYLYQSLYHKKGMETDSIEWHKNHSMLIVQKAAQAVMLTGVSPAKFITEHDDVYDFFLCTNVDKKSKLLLEVEGEEPVEHQRNSRYVISRDGGKLIKVMPPLAKKPNIYRRIGINKEYTATIHNKVESNNPDDYNINYQFYIDETEKLLKPFGDEL